MGSCSCNRESRRRSRRKTVPKPKSLRRTNTGVLHKASIKKSIDYEEDENEQKVLKAKKVPEPQLKAYLSVNIIRSVIRDGKKRAETKFSCSDIQNDVLDIINHIYAPANIKFNIRDCKIMKADEVTSSVYTDDVRDVEKLFATKKNFKRDAVNIYLVPIISDGTNAYQFGTKESFIVQGEHDPEDWGKFSKMQLGILLAHEIGHDLGLEKHSTDPDNLMYSIGPGKYNLEPKQISKIRSRVANKFLARSKALERVSDVISIMELPIKLKKR